MALALAPMSLKRLVPLGRRAVATPIVVRFLPPSGGASCSSAWPAPAACGGGARGFAKLAPPRGDGLGADRHLPVSAEQGEAEEMEEESGDAVSEAAALDMMAPLAAGYHKHAFGRDLDDPLSIEALGGDIGASVPPLESWRGTNNALRATQPRERPSTGSLSLLGRLAALESDGGARQSGGAGRGRGRTSSNALKRNRPFEFPEGKPIRVRILDVDALPLDELHKAFAFTLVRRLPAEFCIKVASRIALYRENFNVVSYENMLKDCSRHFGPTHGPELLALFARCHATIPVPFLLDYTRRFGTFSRKFIAAEVEKSLNPGFLDFMRPKLKGGVRALPPIVSRPWALSSYTRLMPKCSLKSQLFHQLKDHGNIPASELDAVGELPVEVRLAERLSGHGALRVPPPVTAADHRKANRKPWTTSAEEEVRRPALLDAIIAAEASGRGWNPADADNILATAKAAKEREKRHKLVRELAGGAAAPVAAPSRVQVVDLDESDDELEEALSLEQLRRQDRPPSPARPATSGGERGWDEGAAQKWEDLDDGEADVAQRDPRFSLQFEHVVPDSIIETSLARLAEGRGPAAAGAPPPEDVLALADLPERFWTTMRRPFFRHNYHAYRLIEGSWQRTSDPRGPRYQPKKRHRPRKEKEEQRLRWSMRAAGQSQPPPAEQWPPS